MRIFKFDTLQSTNSYLKDHINEHINHDVVFTFNQTNGHGRISRSWCSTKDSLTFSIIFKDDFLYKNYESLSLISAVSLFEVLSKKIDNVSIKWPNDIIVNNKKICGILLESRISTKMEGLILGIGLNVNNEHFDDSLNATSIYLENNLKTNIKDIMLEIINNLLENIKLFKNGSLKHIEIINKINYLLNKETYATIGSNKQLVKVLRILNNNHLLVECNNELIEVSTGEISFHKD